MSDGAESHPAASDPRFVASLPELTGQTIDFVRTTDDPAKVKARLLHRPFACPADLRRQAAPLDSQAAVESLYRSLAANPVVSIEVRATGLEQAMLDSTVGILNGLGRAVSGASGIMSTPARARSRSTAANPLAKPPYSGRVPRPYPQAPHVGRPGAQGRGTPTPVSQGPARGP